MRRVIVALMMLSAVFSPTVALYAQAATQDLVPVPYGPAEFPDWQKDLRRAEIISFGSLPFVTFAASIYYDVFRYFSNNRDEAYLPWPLKKSEIAVPLSQQEQKNILLASVGISLGVAVFDFSIRQIKRSARNRAEERARESRKKTIIIEEIRTQ